MRIGREDGLSAQSLPVSIEEIVFKEFLSTSDLRSFEKIHSIIIPSNINNPGRWAVGVIIRDENGLEDGIDYILEAEAAKEGINLGKWLVDRRLV